MTNRLRGRQVAAARIAAQHGPAMAEAARTLPDAVILADGRVLRRLTARGPGALGIAYGAPDGLRVIASYDATPHGMLLHVSVSYRTRDPKWRDLKLVRDAFFPADVDVIQVLPRAGEYVNIHPHCFHLFQAPAAWEGGWNV